MYVKLFASLYQGTLRGRSDEILVFTNLLAHSDQHGVVDKHFRAIAEETGLPRDRVEAAILNLEAPDSESRSPEMNGCRIVRMDEHRVWGWRIVNYGKYRAIRNEDDRREQNRIAQERHREKVSRGQPASSQAEGEVKGEGKIKTTVGLKPDPAQQEKKKALAKEAVELLAFFNRKAGKNFPPDKHNVGLIVGLLSAGHPAEKIRMVVAKKVDEWKGDPDMVKYLRPATLFGPKNFATKYVGEIPA